MGLLESRLSQKPILSVARAGVIAVLAGMGCSAHADVPNSDADTDAGRQFCSFDVEDVYSYNVNTLRPDIVSRNASTRFYLRPLNKFCNVDLTDRVEVVDAGGRPSYHWGATVCLSYGGTQLCQNTDFVYTGGEGYKGSYTVGPVNFSTFTGLPADWVAQNHRVDIHFGHDYYVRSAIDVDWVSPTMMLDQVSANRGGSQVNIAFTTSEAGYWGVEINRTSGENTVQTRAGCSLFSNKAGNCTDTDSCTFNGNYGVCTSQPRGGVVFNSGSHTVALPFTATSGNYNARLFFVDLNGIPAGGSSGIVDFTVSQ